MLRRWRLLSIGVWHSRSDDAFGSADSSSREKEIRLLRA
jgi:hypothetical protein